MPIGAEHVEDGLLLREGGGIVLQRDDGGRWRLDLDRDQEALLGQSVRIHGVRAGFDRLDVRRVGRVD